MADCSVMLHSLVVENPADRFVVHFLHDEELPRSDITALGRIVTGAGSEWKPLEVSRELTGGFPSMSRYGGVTAWFRLLLPRVLPDVARVLYLDADLLILRPLRSLWEQDLAGRCLAAVTNPLLGADRRRVRADLGLPHPERYFNSGVMLMDLDVLRQTGLMLEAERIARARVVPTPWADQEPLNAALWAHRLDLHPRWNVMNPCFDLPARHLPWPLEQVREARTDPAIVHFIGPYKPWHYRLRHRYATRYFEHLESTPWRGRPQEGRTPRHVLLRPLPPYLATRYEMTEYAVRQAGSTVAPRLTGFARRLVARSPSLHGWLRALHRLLSRGSAPEGLADVLEAFADSIPDVYFIQIGSNDADRSDPLRPYVISRGWRGVLVEPVPYVFERLRSRYGSTPGIELVNAAIADRDGRLPFYFVAQSEDPDLPSWYDQIGSLSLQSVLHPYHVANIPDLAQRVLCAEVPCLTLQSLLHEHPLPTVDLVHVDAEGHDDDIVAQIDLVSLRPTLLLYEHQHLNDDRRAALTARLGENGYVVLDLGPDALAVRSDAPLRVRLAARRHGGRRP